MTFVSIEFILFFLVLFIIYTKIGYIIQKQCILLGASWLFYAYWDFRCLILLIFQCLVTYLTGKIIESHRDKGKKALKTGVIILIVMLGIFKYFNFFRDSFSNLVGISGNENVLSIILPVGISFYTFQSIAYIVDIYNKKIVKQHNFLQVALLISFFPKIAMGPIVAANNFFEQLEQCKKASRAGIEQGIQIFIMGVIKKYVIADRLAVCVNSVYASPSAYSSLSILAAVLSYSIQIYCDFSGYTDMAIGIAKILGFDLCQNFNLPYMAQNPTEFWRRWHISLSTWLRNYLYIPLGGNRSGISRMYVNLFLTMLLGGLWHGANWTFIMWGMLHGIGLVLHKWFKGGISNSKNKEANNNRNVVKIFSIILNYCFISFCWIFFRADTVNDAFIIIKALFQWQSGIQYIYIYTIIYILIVWVAQIYAYLKNNGNAYYIFIKTNNFRGKLVFCCIIWLVLILFYSGETAFIYFQF